MNPLMLPLSARYITLTAVTVLALLFLVNMAVLKSLNAWLVTGFGLTAALSILGFVDLAQTRHSILRNYPILGHLRFILEEIRPEIRQYFLEAETDGMPFPRDMRAIVYQRAKQQLDKKPFGTHQNVYDDNFEWIHHSLAPKPVAKEPFRLMIGGPSCKLPYDASIFNISAMSFGALSANAIRALNTGAKAGGFAHDTGEGAISPYHLEGGGDLIWEIGSGYFGCRTPDGQFSPERFREAAALPQVKMIELKLSQGAKPGHGGVLPATKITPEISSIRGVPMGRDCVSPPFHPAFSTPRDLVLFISRLRELSGGKPTGFKLCIGHTWEFLAILKAILETGEAPDFIVIDGKEGGTGAAPAEFMDHIGMPLRDGLAFAHAALIGTNLRDRIKIGCAGKIISGFDMARAMALGADWCNAARGFMFAVGCIQAQQCHTGECPTGVATQDEHRQRAIVVPDKAVRVANFHKESVKALAELVAAVGLDHPADLKPAHFMRRMPDGKVTTLASHYHQLKPGALLEGTAAPFFAEPWAMARSDNFAPA